ncbi:hypothetical protein [Domibacillus tundrae]
MIHMAAMLFNGSFANKKPAALTDYMLRDRGLDLALTALSASVSDMSS